MYHEQDNPSIEDHLLQKLRGMRRWKKTRLARTRKSFDFQFTVMTYNILSQTALNHHRYLYRNNRCLGEGYRITRIVPEIVGSRSGIVCLQEVEEDLFRQYIQQEVNAEGFSALYKRRTGNKPDGCAILWRRDKFELVDHFDLEMRTPGHKLLNRDNVALIGVFRPRARDCGHTLLYVATTHLLYNPKRGDVKMCQLRWLVAELEKLAFRREGPGGDRLYHPIVLCGDFNFQPFSPLYRFVAEGRLELDEKTPCADLSGQVDSKGKGKKVKPKELSLHKLGIGDSTRFEMTDPEKVPAVGQDTIDKSSEAEKILKPSSQEKVPTEGEDSDKPLEEEKDPSGQTEVPTEEQDSEDKTSEDDKKTTFSHDIKFVPAYKFSDEDAEDLPFTSMTKNTFHTVDHIFYNVSEKRDDGSYTEGKLRLMYTYTLPSPEQGKELGGLPNELLGSDHICLMAQFGLDFRR